MMRHRHYRTASDVPPPRSSPWRGLPVPDLEEARRAKWREYYARVRAGETGSAHSARSDALEITAEIRRQIPGWQPEAKAEHPGVWRGFYTVPKINSLPRRGSGLEPSGELRRDSRDIIRSSGEKSRKPMLKSLDWQRVTEESFKAIPGEIRERIRRMLEDPYSGELAGNQEWVF
ncbi:MAG: hypothetical protein ABID40_01730 [Candidatus Bipolaricaulota bacterium]